MAADREVHKDAKAETSGQYWLFVKCATVEQEQALAAELRAQGRTVKVHVGGNP